MGVDDFVHEHVVLGFVAAIEPDRLIDNRDEFLQLLVDELSVHFGSVGALSDLDGVVHIVEVFIFGKEVVVPAESFLDFIEILLVEGLSHQLEELVVRGYLGSVFVRLFGVTFFLDLALRVLLSFILLPLFEHVDVVEESFGEIFTVLDREGRLLGEDVGDFDFVVPEGLGGVEAGLGEESVDGVEVHCYNLI